MDPPQGSAAGSLLEGALWLAAAGLPVAWMGTFYCEYTLPKLLALLAAVLAGGVAMLLPDASLRPRRTRLDRPLAALLAALALSTLLSRDARLSLLGRHNGTTFGLWQAALCAALFHLAAWGSGGRAGSRVMAAVIGGAAVVGGYAALQGLGWEPFTLINVLPAGERAISTIGSPVFLGAYLAMMLPVALSPLLEGRRAAGGATAAGRLWALTALALIGAGLLATTSRSAWLAAAAGTAVSLALSGSLGEFRRDRRRWIAAAILLALLGAAAASRVARRRLEVPEAARTEAWRIGWEVFKDHPWLGTGPDTFELEFRKRRSEDYIRMRSTTEFQAHAHSDILQALATTGLAGTAAYLWLLAALGSGVWSASRDRDLRPRAAAVGGAVAALFIAMKFNPVSLDSLALASLLAGLLEAPGAPPIGEGVRVAPGEAGPANAEARAGRAWPRWASVPHLALAIASLPWAFKAATADREFKEGREWAIRRDGERSLAHFKRSLSLNPCEPAYHMEFLNVLALASSATPPGPARDEILDLATRSGEAVALCRPGDFNSHYIKGYAALIAALAGRRERLAEAAAGFDAAMAVDPYFMPLLQVRHQVAVLQGEAAKATELEARMKKLGAMFTGKFP